MLKNDDSYEDLMDSESDSSDDYTSSEEDESSENETIWALLTSFEFRGGR